MTAEEILQTLDAEFEVIHHDPPHLYQLGGYFYPADARMTAFRSAGHWALFFEIVGCGAGPQGVRVDVRRYGNGFGAQGAHSEVWPVRLLDARTGGPLDGAGTLDPRRFDMLWNGERYHFAPSESDYAEAGIVFDDTRTDPRAHAAAQVVRYLCERLGHAFFLSEEELRASLAQGWTATGLPQAETMTLFLQTRAWRHPNLSEEELPSRNSSFQALARALENGDLSEWGRQDPASFNTDWRVYDWEEKAEEERQREWATRQDGVWDSLSPELRKRIAEEAEAGAESCFVLPHSQGRSEEAADQAARGSKPSTGTV